MVLFNDLNIVSTAIYERLLKQFFKSVSLYDLHNFQMNWNSDTMRLFP